MGLGALVLTPQMVGCADTPEDENPGPGGLGEITFRVLKGPFVQFIDEDTAVLRFETRTDHEVPVRVTRGGETEETIASQSPTTLEYSRPTLGKDSIPDEKGVHILHEVVIPSLQSGERVAWAFDLSKDETLEGSFLAPVARGEAFRFGWIADTMFPFGQENITRLAAAAPDLVIHGGDIVYDANIFDSWNSVLTAFRPVMSQSTFHLLVGNHEHESQDEYTQQYLRLFANQGQRGDATNYFGLTFGGVRFLCLDSESGEFGDAESAQRQWLQAELEAARDDSDVREIIVAFHRPPYTLSKHAPGSTTVRDALHALYLEFGVRLVLCGHVHAYERFIVDGVTYLVDGGGGALLYDPDEDIPVLEETRPDDITARQIASESYGISLIDFAADGSFTLQRIQADTGDVLERVEFPAPV